VHVSATNAVLVDGLPSPLGTPGADGHNQADPYPIALAPGASVLTADFGFRPAGVADSGVIGDLVWVESDGDGFSGAGDVGQAGVTVELSQNGEVIAATTAGAGGRFSFVHLPAGVYSLQISDDFGVLAGLSPTVPGAAPGQDNNNQVRPYTVTVSAGQYVFTADFGFYRVGRPGAIGDLIWYDADGDGIEDLDEHGIPNVRVAAYLDTNSNGVLDASDTLMASTVTDAAGGYLLTDLPTGTYFVDVLDAANPNGALAGMVHSVGNQSQPDPTAAINLGPGQIYKDADFGYRKEPTAGKVLVGDLVWYDGDGDGQRGSGEPGASGVTVVITDSLGNRIASGITDAAGRYLIEAPAGNWYTVGIDWAVSPSVAGLRLTTPSATFLPPLPAGQQWMAARLGVGEAVQGSAAGVQGSLLGAIGNLVFNDADRNGRFGAGDSPLPGVTVALIRDSNGNRDWDVGEPIIATATTSSAVAADGGNYRFVGVPAGAYLVHVNDTAAVLADYRRGPLGAAGTDGHSQADPYAVTLAAGATHAAADFGFYRGVGALAGVIGNLVWGEVDGNGLFNPAGGDAGLAGVTVALLQGGQTIATTTTGPGGGYAFVGQPDGSYQVTVSDDFGVLAAYSPTVPGPFPGQDNNNQVQPYAVTLSNSSINPTADFGYRTGLTPEEAGARYAIVLNDNADTRPGAAISFTIRITNTGTAWIVRLPLDLAYQTTYLSYRSATPASNDNTDDGLIQWRDLTSAYGALAPGAGVQVVVNFAALADTSRLPGMRATITATVRGAWANPTGPGILGNLVLLGEQSAAAGVRIFQPTGLTVVDLAAARTPDGVAVSWRTENEAQILGFDVLRR
ncbi:MAG: SdrD B-like domain-containing protein, partial [Anaerolineae bacterium]